jgi:hypothetical protein
MHEEMCLPLENITFSLFFPAADAQQGGSPRFQTSQAE